MRGCGVSRRYIDICYCDMTNEVCTAWSDAFFVFASNDSTVWLCLVKSVSFISLGG